MVTNYTTPIIIYIKALLLCLYTDRAWSPRSPKKQISTGFQWFKHNISDHLPTTNGSPPPPTPSGWHKINVDTAFELDSAFSGIVLRNEHGTIIDAATNHNTCLDATTAECIALWEACILISNKKMANMIFESDCLNAISFLIGEPKNCYWKVSLIIEQIRRIWTGWPSWIFKFTPRETNGAAHELAKWAQINLFVGQVPLVSIPINVFCDQGFPIVNNFVIP
ncbi:hypothetical protein CASFOL_010673 [Castilleja foliolosa]|uniref:RNase H type-1 domain-containing protein n=1 Tax=Castilleja foliolosa TaxID=1961234 RepID=A0ABD3DTB1_9LAMI